MTTKLMCGILFALLLFSLCVITHLYCRYTKSYKDDFTYEEKQEIRCCLKAAKERELLCGRESDRLLHLLVKWEIVSGLADED